MIDRPKLFEFCKPSLRNDYTRNSGSNLPPVRLGYVERNFTNFQSIHFFIVAPAQLRVPMSD